jgi:aryl-alcohol dehydrogenase-like predicted oxidoreductase
MSGYHLYLPYGRLLFIPSEKCLPVNFSGGLRLRLWAVLRRLILKYRQLGTSELQVPVVSLGSWLTYSGGIEKAQALACIHKALDLGITFFDTANVYGRGTAESVLAEALAGIPRHSYMLASKIFFPMSDTDKGLSRVQIVKQLDASLKRLRTDTLDLYQCHRYDADTPLEETMEALTQAVRQGKARYIGISEWPLDKIEAAASMPGAVRFVSSQPQYSMLWPSPQNEIFPRCAELGIGQIVWSPLAQGVLTGKYKPGAPPPPGSRAGHGSMGAMLPERWLGTPVLTAVQQVKLIAEREAAMSLAQFALAWVLRRQEVSSAIVGASRPQQVSENAAAAESQIAPELFARAEEILAPFH